MSRLAVLLFGLALSAPTAAPSQTTVRVGPAPSRLYAVSAPGPLEIVPGGVWADTAERRIPSTYWREGALIGGGGLGAFAAYLFYGLCAQSDTASANCTTSLLGGILVGGGVGAVLGALVGGQFPKGEPRPGPEGQE
jgi:hypothetical protein